MRWQRGVLSADTRQLAVELQQEGVLTAGGSIEARAARLEGLDRLGVGWLALPTVRSKLGLTALTDRIDEGRVCMAYEVLKRCRLSVLLSHEH